MVMSETVIIALITAASGILGAFLGSVGSVLGPWWIKTKEINAQQLTTYLESRRKAVVDFSNKKLISLQAYHQVISLNGEDELLMKKLEDANKSVNELYSYIKKEDKNVKDWINNMGYIAFSRKPENESELIKINAFLEQGLQYLLAWHVGEITSEELKPFKLDKNFNPVYLSSWDQIEQTN